jgi:chromosome segregation protein
MPPLREAEARAAAVLQRLVIARETLEQEETRAKNRMLELDQRLVQLAADIERERQQAADAEAALARFAAEEETLQRETGSTAEKRSEADRRVADAQAVLAAAEQTFGELTSTLADLTARRNQFQAAIDSQRERRQRLDRELAGVEAELAQLGASATAARTGSAREGRRQRAGGGRRGGSGGGARRNGAFQRAAGARPCAQSAGGSRAPVQRPKPKPRRSRGCCKSTPNICGRRSQRRDRDWGYEAALGAALGDDLEAPTDPSSPMRWAGALVEPDDPQLPEGVEPLHLHVHVPKELARRIAQIGVIDRADAPRFVALLKSGQRLVSKDGDLWRWDGFSVSANAPTGAARRLAGKNRLADIEAELQTLRSDVEFKRKAVEAAEAEVRATADAETEARAPMARAATRRRRRARAACQCGTRSRPRCGAALRAHRGAQPPGRRP